MYIIYIYVYDAYMVEEDDEEDWDPEVAAKLAVKRMHGDKQV